MQGDIIAITNASGAKVVEYVYDSWGKLISTTGSLASTVGVKNPYRYRGYRYDTETGLYYLNSRYYDPEIGRFINADVYVSTGQGVLGNNMFAYCQNNPIIFVDETGAFVGLSIVGALLIGAAVGGVLGGVYGASTAAATGQNILRGTVFGVLEGGFLGFAAAATPLVGPAVAIGTSVLAGAGFEMVSQGANYMFSNQGEEFNLDWRAVGTSAAYAGLGTYLGAKFDTIAKAAYTSIADEILCSVIGGGFVTSVINVFDFCTACFLSTSSCTTTISLAPTVSKPSSTTINGGSFGLSKVGLSSKYSYASLY